MTTRYIDNKKFSRAVADYVIELKQAEKQNKPRPPIPNYIAECFIMIAEHRAKHPSFAGYPFIDDMIGDAIEKQLRAIGNYNIDMKTRTNAPNAFAYFSQIVFFSFLHRIATEKKQLHIKETLIKDLDLAELADCDDDYESAYLTKMKTKMGYHDYIDDMEITAKHNILNPRKSKL